MQKGRRRRFDPRAIVKKAGSFLGLFAKNSKGLVGLVIIAVFLIIALFPSIFTQYDPVNDRFLAGFMVAPRWLRFLPPILGGEPGLTENYLPLTDSGFEYANMTGWDNVSASHVTFQHMETFNDRSGVFHVSFRRDEVGTTYGSVTTRFYQSFYFPYSGTPFNFWGVLSMFLNGSTTSIVRTEQYINESNPGQWPWPTRTINVTIFDVSMNITLFIENTAANTTRPIWPLRKYYLTYLPTEMIGMAKDGTYVNATNNWIDTSKSAEQIDSFGRTITAMITEKYGASELAVNRYFPKDTCPGYYKLGVDITFFDNINASKPVVADVYFDTLQLGFKGSSWGVMGTDQEGRDLWSQLVYGSRISLYVGVLSSVMAVTIGLVIGLMAGYLGRVVDEILMRICDVLLVLPGLPLLIVLVAVLGTNIDNLILILGALGWMGFARIVRSQVISLRERPFIEAAKAVGAGKTHIMFRHILPNVMSLVYVSLATTVPGNIVAEASLGYLGFTDPSRMSWGLMLNFVADFSAHRNWWWVIPPGLCIALVAIAFIMFGYALDEILNPRLRLRR